MALPPVAAPTISSRGKGSQIVDSRRLDGAPYRAYAGDVVDTLVRPPTAPPSGGGTPAVRKPRRRWLLWLVLGLLAALIAVAATGVTLVANYQPFHAGFKQYGPPKGVGATALQIDWLDAPPNVWTYRIPSYKALTFTYRFSIWNHGPVPITITRFGIPNSEQVDGLTNVPVAIYPDVYTDPSVGGAWEPVRPLTLQPRQEAGVEMRVTLTKCWSDVKWNKVPVTFTVYGIERHVVAPMNVQIDLVGSKPDC